ncbi:MAG: DUF2147 domain-containing protein [Flavobacterium sp.]|uniref:DUF2147 domain-containing protein n=1 Tax=Flavobacterium sp. TaxID=239 RepID=UPI0022BE7889|nr:DUF2147 domain-containing protein [Flavobacterium sp.]MCZ8197099.1 DUF2147 domain-containing protein [Flavobacterium sp.]
MKYIILFFLFINTAVHSQKSDDFIGYWINRDKSITIEIYKNEESYYGKISNSTIQKIQNKKNKILIYQMSARSNRKLYGGMFSDIIKNDQYEIKMKLINPTHMVISRANRLFPKKHYWNKI